MRLALALVVVAVVAGTARADDKTLKPYAGQVVLTPDTPPASFNELPAFLKIAYDKSHHYESLKWDVHFVGVLAKPADKVTLIVSDPTAKPDAGTTELVTMELATTRQVVIGHFKPTKAAGFAAGKTYAVTLVSGKTTLAKAELVLRE
ncbi:MAG TPA: hypothetical protein VFQ65_22420 [Kofleriaceae bacterium]|nr:hypothetical protein [Kofleriaceae bacterium]